MSQGDLLSRFTDGKEPEALRTIGEVAAALKIKPHVLRYWEEQFPMLRPLKRSGGRRYYRTEDLRLVETIDRLVHREGYTLKGARAALQGKKAAVSQAESTAAPSTTAGTPDAIRARMQAVRDALASALQES